MNTAVTSKRHYVDPAPFDRWPREMRQMIGKDYRDIQFAFYYK